MGSLSFKRVVLASSICALLIGSSLTAQEAASADQPTVSAKSRAEGEASSSSDSRPASESAARPQLPPVLASISPADMKKYREFDELLEKGWEVNWAPTAQSLLRDVGGFRSKLKQHGFGLFVASQNTFTYNMAQPSQPVQTFVGGRPTGAHQLNTMLTYNIPSRNIQFSISSTSNYTSWPTGMGPNTFRLFGLQYYQSFLNGKLDITAGYLHNTMMFIGLQTGGSLAQGSLGPKAVLPYMVGLSTSYTAPGVNIRYSLPRNFYGKAGFQRSVDPVMFDDDRHDAVGFRFQRKGLGLLTIQEFGYRREASPKSKKTWIRAGGIFNTTQYRRVDHPSPPFPSPAFMPNNWNVFIGADRQLVQFEKMLPFRGIYGGFAWQYNPPRQNAYTQLREVRLYATGLFRNRPFDMASIVVGNTDFSKTLLRFLSAAHLPIYGDATGVTGSYSYSVMPGVFFNTSIGYTHHVNPTPRLDNPLNLTLQVWTFF